MQASELRPSARKALELRGPENVRALLAHSGPAEGANVAGLFTEDSTPVQRGVSRAEAESWLREKDAERARRESAVLQWTIAGVIAAALGCIAAIVAAVEGWYSLK